MTENKRFSLIEDKQFDGLCLRDNIEKKMYCYDKQDLEKLCKKLNNLQKEKDYYRELRIHLNGLIGEKVEEITDSNCWLEKENIELKRKKQSLENTRMELYEIIECKDDIIKELKKENEALKSDNLRYKDEIKMDFIEKLYYEENKRLKKIIDIADDIIQSHLSSYYIQEWEQYCKNIGVKKDE